MVFLNLVEVDALAESLHAGQVDKSGADYIHHPRAVAAAVEPFGLRAQTSALLHDVPEDTLDHLPDKEARVAYLSQRSVEPGSVEVVRVLTREEGMTYAGMISGICEHIMLVPRDIAIMLGLDRRPPIAAVVKLADNAHNCRADRMDLLEQKTRKSLNRRYRRARKPLVSAVGVTTAEIIFERVNPDLLGEIDTLSGHE